MVVSPDAKHVKKELRGKDLKLTKVADGRLDFTVKGIRGYKGGSIAAHKVESKPVPKPTEKGANTVMSPTLAEAKAVRYRDSNRHKRKCRIRCRQQARAAVGPPMLTPSCKPAEESAKPGA